jgi:ABC-type amino acid transport system permease subunit
MEECQRGYAAWAQDVNICSHLPGFRLVEHLILQTNFAPPLGNSIASLGKDTSLCTTIAKKQVMKV